MSDFRFFTAKFANNDSDDELLRDIQDDGLWLDVEQIVAAYSSKYPGFIKVELKSGSTFCIEMTFSQLVQTVKPNQ